MISLTWTEIILRRLTRSYSVHKFEIKWYRHLELIRDRYYSVILREIFILILWLSQYYNPLYEKFFVIKLLTFNRCDWFLHTPSWFFFSSLKTDTNMNFEYYYSNSRLFLDRTLLKIYIWLFICFQWKR